MLPEFQAYWDSDANYHKGDDGTFTLWGLFAQFSGFVRENFGAMPEQKRHELMAFIEACVTDDESDLDNAACTCFLENLTGEMPLSDQLRQHMGPKSVAFFNHWNTEAEQPTA